MSTKPATGLLADYSGKSLILKQTQAGTGHVVASNQINISVKRVLFVMAITFLLTSGRVWAFVRYCLFAP